MRMILITAVIYFMLNVTEGFFGGISIPVFPAICKNRCTTSKDCKGKLNSCAKFPICRTKVCIAKPNITTTKSTTKMSTTTTTTTTPSTPSTTKPLAPNTCPFPHENEFAKIGRCMTGHKKDAICRVSCKLDRCPSGSSITRCKCQGGKCKWTPGIDSFCKKKKRDLCKEAGGCKPGYICVSIRCSKICSKVCKDSCTTNTDCTNGKTCQRTRCGKKCLPSQPVCPKPCVLNKCPVGYICRAAKPPCKAECVKTYDVPKCPVYRPLSRMPKNVETYCDTKPVTCKVDTADCGTDAVCCYSMVCNKMMCIKKENNCPLKMTKMCTTNKDCGNEQEICVYNFGGCKTCSKDFKCHPYSTSCITDRECTQPRKCRADEKGCLTCQLVSEPEPELPSPCPYVDNCSTNADCRNGLACLPYKLGCKRCRESGFPTPTPPRPRCVWHRCSGDNDCPVGQKCLKDAIGCKQCQLEPTAAPCQGQKCTSNSQCKSGRCAIRGPNCKVCLPAKLPTDCDITRPLCINNAQCKDGEVCLMKKEGCKICVAKTKE